MRTRIDLPSSAIACMCSSKRAPHASASRAQSSGEPPSAAAHASGVGPSAGGQPAASMRRRILFHSIW